MGQEQNAGDSDIKDGTIAGGRSCKSIKVQPSVISHVLFRLVISGVQLQEPIANRDFLLLV